MAQINGCCQRFISVVSKLVYIYSITRHDNKHTAKGSAQKRDERGEKKHSTANVILI